MVHSDIAKRMRPRGIDFVSVPAIHIAISVRVTPDIWNLCVVSSLPHGVIHSPFQDARQRVTARTARLNFAAYDHSYGSFPPGPCPKVKARLGRTKQIWNLTHAATHLRRFCRRPTHADGLLRRRLTFRRRSLRHPALRGASGSYSTSSDQLVPTIGRLQPAYIIPR